MSLMASKELQARCRILAERISESAHIVDHDPSLALYRLQEHVGKSLPMLISRKYAMMESNMGLQGACFDLDNALLAVQSMKSASQPFEHVQEMLRDCVYYKQQLDHSSALSRGTPIPKSKSFHGANSPDDP